MTNSNPDLVDCDYRSPSDEGGVYLCHHPSVRTPSQRVVEEICRVCRFIDLPSEVSQTKPPDTPTIGRQAWNLVSALASFVADGLTTVSEERYAARLEICDTCPERKGNRCTQCGCRLSLKARGRAFDCPLGKWNTNDS